MVDHSTMKLGKQPAQQDDRIPRMARLVAKSEPLPPVPASADWSHGIVDWKMLANDRLSCCTSSACGHALQAMTAAAYTEWTPSDPQVIRFYSESTGYNPNDPSTDQGGVEIYVLRYLLQNGFNGRKIVGYGSIDPKDTTTLKLTIAHLGGAYIGVSLPASAQMQDIWGEGGNGGSSRPGSWGGHAVACVGYDATHVTFVSWGKLMKMTWGFWSTYVDEAYGILWAAMIKDGKSPAGIVVEDLEAEIAELKAA